MPDPASSISEFRSLCSRRLCGLKGAAPDLDESAGTMTPRNTLILSLKNFYLRVDI